jgi:hypothetical protein
MWREFHSGCAIPDWRLLQKNCEPKFFQYVKKSLDQISFNGMDIEMANL